ncbi:SARP family transcriptional regulator [Actinorhabdospora filicis]|uniref:SARP family transcriptional regulator n=1 Tax=Actinorhabdospora filicis TaxID=1785913 RepID=A0A9W6SQ51_9ACTN|nr:BTAD domain-containing putative transcriptional regulator [Actinorhabdospora filicis]GLZ80909.1 SARP family transcriptional regulator [Actinorhabdospora filicis]
MLIAVLGPLEATDDEGRAIPVTGARPRGLLSLLAAEAGQWVSADRIAAALWPDAPVAANTVQSAVSRLRTALRDRDLIASGPFGYRLGLPPEAVDAHRFTALAAEGRAHLESGDHDTAAAVLRRARELWRGERPDALEEVAAETATALTLRREEAGLDLAEAELALGRADLSTLHARAAAHPLSERAQAQLMRGLAAAGRQAEALQVFETTRGHLAEELGVDPSPVLTEVHKAVLRGQAAPRRDNLPAVLTSFIGRDDDLTALRGIPSRLITLTGPGGAGKTRLALQTAAGDSGDVRLVELAPIADPAEVPSALLTALDLTDTAYARRTAPTPASEPVTRLINALRTKRVLLVLDNCEHLIDAAAAITARLLAECPGVRVLATSREPLGLNGETLYPVAPLASADAVRLLAERGRAARPDFTVEGANRAAVNEICARLDGLPLAIELAAARLRSMTPAELAARLDARFRVLTGGDRTALPRHRTLRAVVDWSWELLDDAERDLLARLSVFAGGATLDAVEAVTDDDPLDALASLVDKSLVVHSADGRYRLLETIREYAAERLTVPVHERHALHHIALAERLEPVLRTGEQLTALDLITHEYENLMAAYRWGVREGRADIALRVVAALGWYWWLRGRRVEGAQMATEALRMDGEAAPLHRAVVNAVGAFHAFDAEPDAGHILAYMHKAREIRDAHGLRAAHPLLRLVDMTVVVMCQQDATAIRDTEPMRDDPDPWMRATVNCFQGALLINLGDLDTAAERLATAAEIYGVNGDRWGLSFVLAEQADMAMWRGEREVATALYARAITAEDELGADPGFSQLHVRRAQGDVDALKRALAAARGVAEHNNVVHAGVFLSDVHRREGRFEQAAEALRDVEPSLDLCAGPPHLQALHATARARLALVLGDLETADAALAESRELSSATGDGPIVSQAIEAAAALAQARGESVRAAELLGEAHLVRGMPDRSSPDVAETVEAARALLGKNAYEAAYARGRARDRDEVIGGEARVPRLAGWRKEPDPGRRVNPR